MKKYKTFFLIYNRKPSAEDANWMPIVYQDIYEAQRGIENMNDKEDWIIVKVDLPIEYPKVEEVITAKEIKE